MSFFTPRMGLTLAGSFLLGAGIEMFMIQTGFCACARVSRIASSQRSGAALAGPTAQRSRPANAHNLLRARAVKIVTEKEAERYIERVEQHRELERRTQANRGPVQ